MTRIESKHKFLGLQEVIIVATDTERSSHKVYEKDQIGEVQIADEVVAIIAGLAATEVEGVDSLAGNMSNELIGKLGMKNVKLRVYPGHRHEIHNERDRTEVYQNILDFILSAGQQ